MRRILFSSSMAVMMFAASPAFAHNETVSLSSSLLSGVLHPLTGFDHLLAMLAFGIWFTLQAKEQHKSMPLTFVLMLLAGFVLAISGFVLPAIEGVILSSVLILGLLVATTTRLKSIVALPLTALFAIFHGFAHGAETGSSITALFMLGFICSSTAIIYAAASTCKTIQTKLPVATKFIGLMIAMTGLSLVAA